VPAIKVQLTFEGRIERSPSQPRQSLARDLKGPGPGPYSHTVALALARGRTELGREGPRLLCDVLDNVSGYLSRVGQERPELAPTTTLSEAPSSSG
jgi:hypothetical protein